MHRFSAHRRALFAGLLLTLGALPTAARAMVVDCGPTLCFEYDETQAAVSALGLPVRVGDTMQFLPSSLLLASASGVPAADLPVSFVFDRIYSPSGGELLALRVLEQGDYELIGAGGAAGSRIELTARGNPSAEEVVAAAVFSDTGDSGSMQLWELEVSVAPAAAFAGPASDIRLTIDYLLQASSTQFSDLAWIQNKYLLVTGEVGTPVPLPGTLWLFATAAGLCGWRAKRRCKDYDK